MKQRQRLAGVTHPALPAMANKALKALAPPYDFPMICGRADEPAELFLIDADTAVYFNPNHWLHGALFRRLDDGNWNYIDVLKRTSVSLGSLIHRMPASGDKQVKANRPPSIIRCRHE
jgi:hypothetical protein